MGCGLSLPVCTRLTSRQRSKDKRGKHEPLARPSSFPVRMSIVRYFLIVPIVVAGLRMREHFAQNVHVCL